MLLMIKIMKFQMKKKFQRKKIIKIILLLKNEEIIKFIVLMLIKPLIWKLMVI